MRPPPALTLLAVLALAAGAQCQRRPKQADLQIDFHRLNKRIRKYCVRGAFQAEQND